MAAALYSHKGEGGSIIQGPGLVHAVYGQGVGKTSRCVGLAVRASGAGFKVAWIQFMKEDGSSEVKVMKKLDNFSFYCPQDKHPWLTDKGAEAVHIQHAEAAMGLAFKALQEGAQVMICDEILNTLFFQVLRHEQVAELIQACRGKCELALSGSAVSPEMLDLVDYATELKQVKHPYYQGQTARLGIEF